MEKYIDVYFDNEIRDILGKEPTLDELGILAYQVYDKCPLSKVGIEFEKTSTFRWFLGKPSEFVPLCKDRRDCYYRYSCPFGTIPDP